MRQSSTALFALRSSSFVKYFKKKAFTAANLSLTKLLLLVRVSKQANDHGNFSNRPVRDTVWFL
jgi:hypothetical protein